MAELKCKCMVVDELGNSFCPEICDEFWEQMLRRHAIVGCPKILEELLNGRVTEHSVLEVATYAIRVIACKQKN